LFLGLDSIVLAQRLANRDLVFERTFLSVVMDENINEGRFIRNHVGSCDRVSAIFDSKKRAIIVRRREKDMMIYATIISASILDFDIRSLVIDPTECCMTIRCCC
jgi:hypothetical protein